MDFRVLVPLNIKLNFIELTIAHLELTLSDALYNNILSNVIRII